MKSSTLIQTEAIKSFIGANANFNSYNRAPRTPLNIFLDFVCKEYEIDELELYLGDTSYPQLFILEGLSPPCIYVDIAFLERSHSFLTLPSMVKNAETTYNNIYQLALRYISDFLIAENEIDFAFKAFIEYVDSPVSVLYDPVRGDLELMEYGEYYITIWFFFIAHELGHFIQKKNSQDEKYTFLVNEKSIKSVFFQLVSSARENSIKKILENNLDVDKILEANEAYDRLLIETDLDDLKSEILSDIIGIEILVNFAHPFLISYAKKEKVDYYDLL